MNFLLRCSVSLVVGEGCFTKSEKLNFGVFPNENVEKVFVGFDENWKSVVGVFVFSKLVKENPESEELDGLLWSSSFVITISVCLSK